MAEKTPATGGVQVWGRDPYRGRLDRRFGVWDRQCEFPVVLCSAVVTVAVGELALQGLGDEGGGVHRLAGLGLPPPSRTRR